DVQRVGLERESERGDEERKRSRRVPARSAEASALEVDPGAGDLAGGRERLRLVDDALAPSRNCRAALDACELCQHLRTAAGRALFCELCSEARLRVVEVVEVPERTQAIEHREPIYARPRAGSNA